MSEDPRFARLIAADRRVKAAQLQHTHALDERRTVVEEERAKRSAIGGWSTEGLDRIIGGTETMDDALVELLAAFREFRAAAFAWHGIDPDAGA